MRGLGLHWPKDSVSSLDISPSELFQVVRDIKSLKVCRSFGIRQEEGGQLSAGPRRTHCRVHDCKQDEFLSQIADIEVSDTQTKHLKKSSQLTHEIQKSA